MSEKSLPQEHTISDSWITRASAGDACLRHFILAKEKLMDTNHDAHYDDTSSIMPSPRQIDRINGRIISRQLELGIDPMVHPAVPYDKEH